MYKIVFMSTTFQFIFIQKEKGIVAEEKFSQNLEIHCRKTQRNRKKNINGFSLIRVHQLINQNIWDNLGTFIIQ